MISFDATELQPKERRYAASAGQLAALCYIQLVRYSFPIFYIPQYAYNECEVVEGNGFPCEPAPWEHQSLLNVSVTYRRRASTAHNSRSALASTASVV